MKLVPAVLERACPLLVNTGATVHRLTWLYARCAGLNGLRLLTLG
jgi:hypothetical protein